MKKQAAILFTMMMVSTLSVGVFAAPLKGTGKIEQAKILVQKVPMNGSASSFEKLYEKIKQSGNCSIGDLPEIETPDQNEKPVQKPDQNQKPENSDQNQSDFAAEVVRLVNQERAKAGLSALSTNTSIRFAAQTRAAEQKQSFSHTRPNGSHFSTALTQSGVRFRGAGENIAMGQKTPEQVMNAWMNSQGHRENILNPNFTSIGVGSVSSGGTVYWVQLFTY